MINETMAHRFWPDESPIGKHVIYARESIVVEIVGIAADVKDWRARRQQPVQSNVRTLPAARVPDHVAGDAGPSNVASAVRREITQIDPDQPVANVRTMDQVIADSVSQPRLRTTLIGSFAALALILAVIGIAGVVAWSVSQRTNEIAIRVALGARSSNVIAMILRQAFLMIGGGQLIGLIGALLLTRVLSTLSVRHFSRRSGDVRRRCCTARLGGARRKHARCTPGFADRPGYCDAG